MRLEIGVDGQTLKVITKLADPLRALLFNGMECIEPASSEGVLRWVRVSLVPDFGRFFGHFGFAGLV